MKKEIAEQWVAALRSGDYAQGRSVLKDNMPYHRYLALLNDTGMTFAEIADYIESNWERL